MPPQSVRPNGRNELEGTERHEHRARNDVDECQDRMARETRIKRLRLRHRTRADAEEQNERTSRCRRETDEHKDNDAGPDQAHAP